MRSSSLIRDQRGASIVEFAIVAPAFFLLIMGILEFGLFMFHKVVIESITMQVGREASLNTSVGQNCTGNNGNRYAYITCYVQQKSAFLINGEQTQVSINTVAQGGTRAPDICLGNPPRSTPTCSGEYEDVNGNGRYDPPAVNNSVGAPGDLIEVRVSYPWQVLVPFMKYFIGSERTPTKAGEEPTRRGVVMITSSTVFRNEPAAQ